MGTTVNFATAADGVNVAWTAVGNGPVLVFSRGWISHLEHSLVNPAFRSFIEVLAEHFTVVRFDGRGNGMSDWDVPRPIAFDHLVDDLTAVVDAVGCDRCTLWGSSWGGPTAVAYAALHPGVVDRLVLEGTFADGDRLADPERREAFLGLFDVASAAPDAVFAALSHLTKPDGGDATANLAERGRQSIRPDIAKELYALLYTIDVTAMLPGLPMPTLVLHRRRSKAVPFDCARRMAAAIPGAHLVPLEGTAHNAWDESPEDALAALSRFFGVPLAKEARARPAGTTAVLFSDIVESTAHQRRVGDDRAYGLVRVHDVQMRAAIAAFGGREVKHTGDGIMAAFPSAAAAVRAAGQCQAALARLRAEEEDGVPRISIGVNVGEPLVDDAGDLHGLAVALAARACAAADADQILVTPVVRDLLAGSDVVLRSVGDHVLKGLDEPVELFEVGW